MRELFWRIAPSGGITEEVAVNLIASCRHASPVQVSFADILEMIRRTARSITPNTRNPIAFLLSVVPRNFSNYRPQVVELHPMYDDGPACLYCNEPLGNRGSIQGLHFECYAKVYGESS